MVTLPCRWKCAMLSSYTSKWSRAVEVHCIQHHSLFQSFFSNPTCFFFRTFFIISLYKPQDNQLWKKKTLNFCKVLHNSPLFILKIDWYIQHKVYMTLFSGVVSPYILHGCFNCERGRSVDHPRKAAWTCGRLTQVTATFVRFMCILVPLKRSFWPNWNAPAQT